MFFKAIVDIFALKDYICVAPIQAHAWHTERTRTPAAAMPTGGPLVKGSHDIPDFLAPICYSWWIFMIYTAYYSNYWSEYPGNCKFIKDCQLGRYVCRDLSGNPLKCRSDPGCKYYNPWVGHTNRLTGPFSMYIKF